MVSRDLALVHSLTTPRRFRHCRAVAAECAQLARRFALDERLAARTGLLHDLARDLDADTLRILARSPFTPDYPSEYDDRLILLHAPAAVRLVRERLSPLPVDAEAAVVFHPVGDPRARPLSLILQIADLTARDREWDEAETLRNAVEQAPDLTSAARIVLRRKAAWQESQGRPLLDVTRCALARLA